MLLSTGTPQAHPHAYETSIKSITITAALPGAARFYSPYITLRKTLAPPAKTFD